MNSWYVLVVEDDPDGQEVVSRMLRHHGVPAVMADSGETAISLLNDVQYTAAVIDLALPGIDGWQVLKAIRENPGTEHLPCVAVTAFHSADVAVKAIAAGFDAYFPKPLDATSFVRELQRVVVG
jgi:CheY-like chemotaxis protein